MGLSSYAQGTIVVTSLNVPVSLTSGTGIGTLGSYFAEFDISNLIAGDTIKAYIVSATLLSGVVNQITNDAPISGPASGFVIQKYITGVASIWTNGDIFVVMTAGVPKSFTFRIGQFS